MGKKRIPSMESDEQSSKMISNQSIWNGKSIYEDFCLRHPNLTESIFDQLDNKSLIKCRKVSKVLKTFMADPTIILKRKIEKTLGNRHQFAKLWKPILKSLSANILKQLELATNLFYSGYKMSNDNLEDPVQLISKEDPRSNLITPLHVAAGTGKPSLWRTLNLNFVAGPMVIEKGNSVQPTDSGNSTLHYADISGNFDACQLIMGEIEDENLRAEDEKIPPHFAAKEGDVNICEWVLAENDDSNPGESAGRTPVHDISKMLIEKVTSVQPKDGYENSPLHYAAMHGNLETCRLIMEEIEDKNPKNLDEKTPLHFAAENGHLKVCKIILDQVSPKNPTDGEGNTPLHAVALIGNDELYEEIASRADDVNPPDNYGWTPLHSAAKEGHFAICEWILAETDNANPGDNAGRTPLHEAANSCYAKICELITEELWAEDRNPRDNLGNTPRELWEKASKEFQQKLFGNIDDADGHEPNGGSDDSEEQSSEDEDGGSDESNEQSSDDSEDETNESHPPKPKKARVEPPVIADNEAIPQVLNNLANNLVPSSHFKNDNNGDHANNYSFATNVNPNLETGTSSGSNEDFQALSPSNPLKNGWNTPPPTMTMFGEDANNSLDQLVVLPTKKELHSVASMKGFENAPPPGTSNGGLLESSDDSKEQTIEDEDVFFSNPPDIGKVFHEILVPPPASAMLDQLVELQTSKELLSLISPMKDSDDTKEQSSEDEDVENKNLENERHLNICDWVLAETDESYDSWKGSNGAKDHTNETQPPKAKMARVETIFIADNKAIPQVDGRASVSSFGSNETFQETLPSNLLENGNTTPPPIMTMFGEDANNFLDHQLVRFPTSKELHSDYSMKGSDVKVKPPLITSNGELLGGSDDSIKVCDDSKEQTTEDDEVDDTDIDRIFSEMLIPPPVSAIHDEDANNFSEQLVGFQTSQKLHSDDSKEQSNEKVDKVHEANDTDVNWKVSDDSKNQTNETQPSKAKKAKVESPFIADNKASYDYYGNNVHSNIEGRASDPIFGSNEGFQALLSSYPLENGDTPLPTLPTLSEEANNSLDQLVEFETSMELHSDDSMKGSDDFQDKTNETQSPRDKKAKVRQFVIPEGIDIFEFENLINCDDSANGSDDSKEQSAEDEDENKVNETDDNWKGPDQTNETRSPRDKKAKIEPLVIAGWTIANPAHPVPMPLKAKVEPLVITEEVNNSEFEKFKTSNDSLKGSDDSMEQSTEDRKVEDVNDTDDNLKGSDDSQDQPNESHPPRAKKAKIEEVLSIRRKLEKMTKSGEHGQALDLLEKLDNMDINLGILKDTMIGFTLQALKKSSSDEEIILKSKSLIKTWKKFVPGQEETSDKKESSSSIVIEGWTITNPAHQIPTPLKAKVEALVKTEEVKDSKFEKFEISGDSMKGSDDLKEQSIEDGEVNDADDTFKNSDDSKDQTKETRAKKVKVEPFVIPKKVNDFEFKEFKATRFALFKANGQQQLPMEDVKMTIFEKTRLTKGQLKTCIEKGSELNLFMLDSDILYIIEESKEVWFGGADDSKVQNTEDVDVKKDNGTDDNLKGSDNSKDQTNETPPPKAVNRNLKNDTPLAFLPKITSSLPTISWAIANPAHSVPTPLKAKIETSMGFQASEVMQPAFSSHKKHKKEKINKKEKRKKGDRKHKSLSNNGEAEDEPLAITEDGEIDDINDASKVSDDPEDQTKETQPPIYKKHRDRKHENSSNNGEIVSISGQSGSEHGHHQISPSSSKKHVVAEEVNDSEFEKFKTPLFVLFKADRQNRQQQLPMKDVKVSIFEQTSLTEGQLITCIERASDLNLVMLANDVLYFI